jgi:hypothetical protein
MARDDKEQYTDDAPITSKAHDRFSRSPFAERISQVLARRTDPSSIVVGIYGPWGDGKTSVLNMMIEVLAPREDVVCVAFNPWHFEDERRLIRAFFDTLADALGKKLTTRMEELGGFLQRYGSLLSFASLTVAGGVAEISPGLAVAGLGGKLSAVELEELKRRVSALLVKSGKRIIVFIDDVDRLDRCEVHAVLKLIKLSASFANTAYVVAFDDEAVAASLGERYGAGGIEAGRQFLQKIIQVPLHLPDAEDTDLRALSFEGIDTVLRENSIDLTEEEAEAVALHFTRGIMPAMRTPRQVKRYVNAIRFALPLLKGEVHIVDQLLIEALRSAYSNLYLSVRTHPDVYTGETFSDELSGGDEAAEAARGVVDAGLAGLTSREREGALHLLKALFPRLNGIYGGSSYGRDWNKSWYAEKRITSDDYFRRYFQYAVPRRDIADSRVRDLLDAARTGKSKEIAAFFREVSERKAWTRCLDKLFARVRELGPVGAKALALGLAVYGEEIPHERGPFAIMTSPAGRASTLAAVLVKRIPDPEERLAAARDLMRRALPLTFAAECLRWLRVESKDEDGSTALIEDEGREVGSILAARIAKDVSENPDYSRHGRAIGGLLWLWKTYGPEGEMQAYLTVRFGEHPDAAVSLLDAFRGRAWGLDGLSHKSEFDRSEFDAVAELINPAIVHEALNKTFPGLLAEATFDRCHELSGHEQTACQFAAIYQKVKEEQAAKTAADESPGSE